MKRKKKQGIAFLLLFILVVGLFSGCSKQEKQGESNTTSSSKQGEKEKETGEVAKGRFVESSVKMPEVVEAGEEVAVSMLLNENNEIEVITLPYSMEPKVTRYTLKDGSWEKEELNKIAKENSQTLGYTYGPDGALYFVRYNMEDYQIKEGQIEKLTKDGKIEQIEGITFSQEEFAKSLQVLGENQFVTANYDRTSLWENGTKLDVTGTSPFSQEGKIITFSEQSGALFLLDQKTGEKINEIKLDGPMGVLTGDGENWYLLSKTGIHRMALEGNTWETLVEGSRNSMSKPSCNPEKLIKLGEEFYAMYQGENGKREIMKYVYDPDMPTKPSQNLSVVTINENEVLQQAAIDFMKDNPDVNIDVQVMQENNSSATVADNIKVINMEILAGKGADVLFLDQMPVDSYVEKGILEDLTDIMEQLIASNQLNENIANSYKEDGKIYMMPLRIGIPFYFGDKEALKVISSIEQLASQAQKDGTALLGDGYFPRETLFRQLYSLYQDKLFDEKGTMIQEEFQAFLEQAKTIIESCHAVDSEEDTMYEDTYNLTSSVIYGEGSSKIGYGRINNLLDTIVPWEMTKRMDGGYTFINGKFIPYGLIGVNSYSENKEIAKKFVAFLFSKEIQSVNVSQGFSVNPEVIEGLKEYEDDFLIGLEVKGEEIDCMLMDKARLEELIGHFSELKEPVKSDLVFEDMVVEATMEYLDGTKSVEETVQLILDKTKTYLSE